MLSKEINHWMMKLPDFLPNSRLKDEYWKIEEHEREIAWLEQEIEAAERRIENSIAREYSPEEIARAKHLFDET